MAYPNSEITAKWEPAKTSTSGKLILLSLVVGILIGFLSDSPLAFAFPFLVIGLLGFLFTWYNTEIIVVLCAATVMYAKPTKLHDPLAMLCFLILAAQVILYGRRLVRHPTTYFIFFYFCWTVLGIALGTDLAENIDYLITFISLMIYYVIIINFIKTKKWLLRFPMIVAGGYALMGVAYTYLMISGQLGEFMAVGEVLEGFVKGKGEVKPILKLLFYWLEERNFLCLSINFWAAICIYSYWGHPNPKVKKLSIILFIFLAAAVIFSGSRAGLAGFLIVGMLVCFYERKRKEVWWAMGIGGAAIAILFPLVMGARFKEKEAIVDPRGDYSKYTRKELLKGGIKMARDNIFFGVGPRNFSWAFKEYYWKPIYIPEAFKNLEAHNTYVELAAEGGIFILILFLTILVLVIVNFHLAERRLRNKDPGMSLIMRGGKIGFLGWMFCAFFLSATGDRMLWVIVGYSVASLLVSIQVAKSIDLEKKQEEIKGNLSPISHAA